MDIDRKIYHPHGLSYDKNCALVCDDIWIYEEEVGECDVEEGEGGDDCLCGNEAHVGGSLMVSSAGILYSLGGSQKWWSELGKECGFCRFCRMESHAHEDNEMIWWQGCKRVRRVL